MRAQRLFFSPGPKIEVGDIEVPAPGPNEIRVRATHSYVSAGSEMNFFRVNPPGAQCPPINMGYMTVGLIEQLGPGVEGYAVGQRVLTCANHGDYHLVKLDDPGHSAWYIETLDDAIPDRTAGFVILGDVALHGVRRAALQIDESVAVFGAGIVGQLTLQLARLSGAYPVIAVDLYDSRLELARQSGATHLINADTTNPVPAILDITGGLGVETIFHCTATPAILQTIMEACADRAVIVLSGSAPGKAEIGLQAELLRKELSILGNYEAHLTAPHPYWPWTRQRNRRACLRLLQSGELKLNHLVTHVVPASEAQAMYEMMARGSDDWMGVVFTW